MKILALNCGSSSLKYQLFDWEKKEVVAVGIVERIGIEGSFIKHEVPSKDQEIKKEDRQKT